MHVFCMYVLEGERERDVGKRDTRFQMRSDFSLNPCVQAHGTLLSCVLFIEYILIGVCIMIQVD